jgi:hypothetical protein
VRSRKESNSADTYHWLVLSMEAEPGLELEEACMDSKAASRGTNRASELDEGVRTCRASSGRQHCDHHWIYRDSINLHWYGILVILEGSGFLHGWGLRSESMIGTCMCSGVREFDWIGWRLGFRGPTSGQCSLWAVAVFRGRSIDAGLRLEGDLALFPCTLHCC